MLEEILDDDIDNMDFDPADFDPQNVIGSSAYDSKNGPARLVPSSKPSASAGKQDAMAKLAQAQAQYKNVTPMNTQDGNTHFIKNEEEMEEFKTWNLLYPCYFDADRSHTEGRRVSKSHAVKNPQAQTIMQGLRQLGIPAILEATKTHPRDWANTGRVRYLLKDDELSSLRTTEGFGSIKNKRHLFVLISQYMKEHPTTKNTPFESPVYRQMQMAPGFNKDDERQCEPLAVPRGWKINEILPVISPAITGGKGAEDMMEQMSNSMFPGMNAPNALPGGGTPAQPKKVKRINIRK